MGENTSVLGSLHSVDGTGVVRVENRFETGIDHLWAALTDPVRLAAWFGEVEGELQLHGAFRVQITLSGERTGSIDACEPPHHLRVTMRDPDPEPGQPGETMIKLELATEDGQTSLVWQESGLPIPLLAAYGAGTQIHVEHLADHIGGRKPRDVEARWSELFPAYEALAP